MRSNPEPAREYRGIGIGWIRWIDSDERRNGMFFREDLDGSVGLSFPGGEDVTSPLRENSREEWG